MELGKQVLMSGVELKINSISGFETAMETYQKCKCHHDIFNRSALS